MRHEIVYLGIILIVAILAGAIFLPDILGEGGLYSKIDSFKFGLNSGKPDNNDNPITGEVIGETEERTSGVSEDEQINSLQNELSCYSLQISYSIKNFIIQEICEEYYQEVCIQKRMICSVEAQNFDPYIGGIFGIRMHVVESRDLTEESIKSEYQEKFIATESSGEFDFEFVISSLGLDGNANKELKCLYVTEKIPRREICSGN